MKVTHGYTGIRRPFMLNFAAALALGAEVHLDADLRPVRWRVENSWSETAGTDGYFVMSDKWMDEFCYQAVVDPSLVSKEVRDVLKQKPKVLPLWDPMGALA